MPPLFAPCACSPARLPNFYTSIGISASPIGRGAYVAALQTIFWAIGTANLIRFDSFARNELAPLAVTGIGAATLRGVVYNPSNNRLYSCDQTTGNIVVINPTTGAAVAFAPPDAIGNDLLYCTVGDFVFFTGALSLVKIDTANTLSSVLLGAGTTGSGLVQAGGAIVVARTDGAAVVNPTTLGIAATANAVSERAVTYGLVSGQCMVGRQASGADGVRAFNPLAGAFTALAGAPVGLFPSGAYSPVNRVHYMVESLTGICWFFDDVSTPVGAILGKFAIGIPTAAVQDSFPVQAGNVIFLPAGTSKTVNVFL